MVTAALQITAYVVINLRRVSNVCEEHLALSRARGSFEDINS